MDSAVHFIRSVQPTDIAVVIQSKSRTPPPVREAIFSALRSGHDAGSLLQEGLERH
jgi:hypothetical protein